MQPARCPSQNEHLCCIKELPISPPLTRAASRTWCRYASPSPRRTLYITIDQKPKTTFTALKRLRNIAENPAVALVVDRYDEDWSLLGWVMLHGRAEILPAERNTARPGASACAISSTRADGYRAVARLSLF